MSPPMTRVNQNRGSLRRRMYLALSVPWGAILVLASISAYYVASSAAREVHDRWLSDAVNTLAQLEIMPSVEPLQLTQLTGRIVLWDADDQTWFRVVSTSGETLAGSSD